MKCHVLRRLCYEKWRIYTNVVWEWHVSLKILAAFSLPQLSSWLSAFLSPRNQSLLWNVVSKTHRSLLERQQKMRSSSPKSTQKLLVEVGLSLGGDGPWKTTGGEGWGRRLMGEDGNSLSSNEAQRAFWGEEFGLRSSSRSLFGKSGEWK